MRIRAVFLVLFQFISVISWGEQTFSFLAENGILDASFWDLGAAKLPLNGRWIYYQNQLVSPQDTHASSRITRFFPMSWNGVNVRGSGQGYATYELNVLLPATYDQLALEIPQMYSSYRLWLNGKPVASCGMPDSTADETTPQWRTQVVVFKNPGHVLHLILQVANFHHAIGGSRESIFLATPEIITRDRALACYSNLAEVALILGCAIFFLFTYFFKHKQRVVLFFSLLCLSWAIRSCFSNLYLVTIIYPDFNWHGLIRIEYLSLFSTVIFGLLFLHYLFQAVSHAWGTGLLVSVNLLFALFVLVVPPLRFTEWLPLYLASAFVTLGYGIVLTVRAGVQAQKGVWYLVVSTLLGIVIFGYDILAYSRAYPYAHLIMNVGYISIFSFLTLSLMRHLDIIKSRDFSVLTYRDLYDQQTTGAHERLAKIRGVSKKFTKH